MDIAVVLERSTADYADPEQRGDLAYPIEPETGIFLQTIPVPRREWESGRSGLVAEMRRRCAHQDP